jgi:phosphoribosyl 1,2-cyclic phosphodiesterase
MLAFRSHASSSKGNLHEITDGETTILLDCGLPWKKVQELLEFKTSDIAAICLSHEHKDHSKGIADAAKRGIDCYALPETFEALNLKGHRFHPIDLAKQFNIGTFRVRAFSLEHDVPNAGFLLTNQVNEKALYITDSYYCEYRFGAGLRIIAVECNYSIDTLDPDIHPAVKNRLYKSHFELGNLKKFLQANDLSQVQEIHLLHLSGKNSDAEGFKREIQQLSGAPVYILGDGD